MNKMDLPAKIRKVEHYLCQHCGHFLNEKAFKDHRRLFFSPTTKQWIRSEEDAHSNGSDDNLPSLPESCSSDDDVIPQQKETESYLSSDSLEEPFMDRDVDIKKQQSSKQGY